MACMAVGVVAMSTEDRCDVRCMRAATASRSRHLDADAVAALCTPTTHTPAHDRSDVGGYP